MLRAIKLAEILSHMEELSEAECPRLVQVKLGNEFCHFRPAPSGMKFLVVRSMAR